MRRSISSFAGRALLASTLTLACVGLAAAATNYARVFDFTGGNDGSFGHTAVTFDSSGNAYATTVMGGTFGCGTVDQFKPTQQGVWQEKTLWIFSCYGDGKNPYGGVTIGPNGHLYGITAAGGMGLCSGDGCGVVYEVSGKHERVIYAFTGMNGDGFGPGNAPVFDSAGNLYGTTPDGGKFGVGTVYQLVPKGNKWTEHILHSFTGKNDGAVGSKGPLFIDSSNAIYGTTEVGGAHSAGTVYKLAQVSGKWKLTTIYAFRGTLDGSSPYGGVIADKNGVLYGTTYFGGNGSCSGGGCGLVFALRPSGHGYAERVLHTFAGGMDGSYSTSQLLLSNGHLYGTTSTGGFPPCDCGTAFRVNATTGQETILHRFGKGEDGSYPYYQFTPWNGLLYSSTAAGGNLGQGTLFGLAP